MNNPEMEKLNWKSLIQSLQSVVPENAQNLLAGFDLIGRELETARVVMGSEISKAAQRQDYPEVRKLSETAEEIGSYVNAIHAFLQENQYNDTDRQDKLEVPPGRRDKVERPNYNDYRVDNSIPYDYSNLNENLTDIRPAAFTYKDHKYPITYWKELLVKICELLYLEDKDLFESLIERKEFRGKKNSFISRKPDSTRRHIPNTEYYVYSNWSAEETRRKVMLMIDIYGREGRTITYYRRRDYKSLHNKETTE